MCSSHKGKSRTPSHTIGVTEGTYRRVDRGLVQSKLRLRLIMGIFRIIQGVSRNHLGRGESLGHCHIRRIPLLMSRSYPP